jgi:hypothetical protein
MYKVFVYGPNGYYDALTLAKEYAEEYNMEIEEFPLAGKIKLVPKEKGSK